MPAKTLSEEAFEQYLFQRGIEAQYEELPVGVTQPVDYTFEIAGLTVRFDVKEWEPSERITEGFFNSYTPVRNKIDKGRRKFKQYKGRGEPCVLVLCHYGPQLILLDNLTIFGAMRGDLGWRFPFDTRTGVGDPSRLEQRFLGGGSMVRTKNTTISAVAILASLNAGIRRLWIEIAKRERIAGRPFTFEETLAIGEELSSQSQFTELELRLIVYDNLDATVPLPAEFPAGPYDERIGRLGNRLKRLYIGTHLAAIEEDEDTLGIQRSDPLGLRRSEGQP